MKIKVPGVSHTPVWVGIQDVIFKTMTTVGIKMLYCITLDFYYNLKMFIPNNICTQKGPVY